MNFPLDSRLPDSEISPYYTQVRPRFKMNVKIKSRMKGTGIAHSVQGLICPHGHLNSTLRLFPVEAIYVAMAALKTKTTIEFFHGCGRNVVTINGQQAPAEAQQRVERFLKSFCNLIPPNSHFVVESISNLLPNVGLSSSSSAFAALALAVDQALGTNLDRKTLSILARHGSGSAAGAVVGGVSVLHTGESDSDGYATQILTPEAFPFKILIIKNHIKKSSDIIHEEAATSPLFASAIRAVNETSRHLQSALASGSWSLVGRLTEKYLYLSYAVIMTGNSNFLLWNPETVRALALLRRCREELGISLFFSMNTGSNVYVYVQKEPDLSRLERVLLDEEFTFDISEIGGAAQSVNDGCSTDQIEGSDEPMLGCT